jgi:2,3-bisphosphoglycerate-dependent phosphoglycerate mutase
MSYLSLVRHGQSEWNEKNLFTGWENPGLTDKGLAEAKEAGINLNNLGITYDHYYTSILDRAIITAEIIIKGLNIREYSLVKCQELNERDYGDLTGLNKDDARKKWGEEQVHIWRRSFDIPPPNGESLKDTAERVIPFFFI